MVHRSPADSVLLVKPVCMYVQSQWTEQAEARIHNCFRSTSLLWFIRFALLQSKSQQTLLLGLATWFCK